MSGPIAHLLGGLFQTDHLTDPTISTQSHHGRTHNRIHNSFLGVDSQCHSSESSQIPLPTLTKLNNHIHVSFPPKSSFLETDEVGLTEEGLGCKCKSGTLQDPDAPGGGADNREAKRFLKTAREAELDMLKTWSKFQTAKSEHDRANGMLRRAVAEVRIAKKYVREAADSVEEGNEQCQKAVANAKKEKNTNEIKCNEQYKEVKEELAEMAVPAQCQDGALLPFEKDDAELQ